MTKRLVFDIDGVLRDLNGFLISKYKLPIPREWYAWDKIGIDIYEVVSRDISILEEASPTKYLEIVQKYCTDSGIELWSHQPKEWQLHTEKWLYKFLDRDFTIFYFTPKEKYIELQKQEDVILVDDYPLFESYDRIALVDQSYNRKVKSPVRIKTEEDLKLLLRENNYVCTYK